MNSYLKPVEMKIGKAYCYYNRRSFFDFVVIAIACPRIYCKYLKNVHSKATFTMGRYHPEKQWSEIREDK